MIDNSGRTFTNISRGLRSNSAQIVVARLATAVVSFLFNVLTVRLIVSTFGSPAYAGVALIGTLPSLLIYSDLGMGAAIVNAGVDLRVGKEEDAKSTLAAAQRVLLGSGVVMVAGSIVLLAIGAWPVFLGRGIDSLAGGEFAATAVLALSGCGTIAGASSRLLQAAGKMRTIVMYQGLSPALTLMFTFLVCIVPLASGVAAIATALASLVISVLLWIPVQRTYGSSIFRVIRRSSFSRKHLWSVLRVGSASMIVTVGLAIGFQLDRVVLSHVSTVNSLVTYSLAGPLYSALYSILTPVGMSFWPKYRARLAGGDLLPRDYFGDVALMGGIAVLLGIGLVLVGPLVIQLMDPSTPRNEVVPTLLCFGLLLVVQAIHFPGGMMLTDEIGYATQSVIVLSMAALNVLMSIEFGRILGAPGVVLGSVIAVGLWQAPLTAWLALRRFKKRPLRGAR